MNIILYDAGINPEGKKRYLPGVNQERYGIIQHNCLYIRVSTSSLGYLQDTGEEIWNMLNLYTSRMCAPFAVVAFAFGTSISRKCLLNAGCCGQ